MKTQEQTIKNDIEQEYLKGPSQEPIEKVLEKISENKSKGLHVVVDNSIKADYKTQNDIPKQQRNVLVSVLNQQLADMFDLFSQIKQAHWNIKGPHFLQFHELFDTLAKEVLLSVDDIAERATTLGGPANGTLKAASAKSTLPEFPEGRIEDIKGLAILVNRYSCLAISTRECISTCEKLEDPTTADLFVGVSRSLDKSLWILESHLPLEKSDRISNTK